MATNEQRSFLGPDLGHDFGPCPGTEIETLALAIAHSPIIVAQAAACRYLPDSFEDVDVAILDWIAAEGRRVGRSLIRV
jgi:hypothetical protein